MNSPFATLNRHDFIKGIVLAILTPVLGYAVQILQGGSLALDWSFMLKLALSAFGAYIIKNYFTDSEGHPLGFGSEKGVQ